jgi:hypothetical protein
VAVAVGELRAKPLIMTTQPTASRWPDWTTVSTNWRYAVMSTTEQEISYSFNSFSLFFI